MQAAASLMCETAPAQNSAACPDRDNVYVGRQGGGRKAHSAVVTLQRAQRFDAYQVFECRPSGAPGSVHAAASIHRQSAFPYIPHVTNV